MPSASGHMAKRIWTGPAVRGTAVWRRVLPVEGVPDLAVADLVLAVDAVDVGDQQDGAAAPGAGSALWLPPTICCN